MVESLADYDALLREVGENVEDVLWLIDCATCEFIYISPAYERLWCRSCESLKENPLSWLEAIDPRDRPFVAEAFERHLRGAMYDVKYRIVLPDGTLRWIHARARPICDQSGRVVRAAGIAIDVTAREQALRFSRFAVDHAADAIYWLRPDGRIVDINEAGCRALGYCHDELLSLTVHDIDPNLSRSRWTELWQQLRQRGSFIIQSHHRARHGHVYPVEIQANYVVFDDEPYCCSVARDVTQRERHEEALRASEERLRLLIDTAHDAIFIADADTGMLLEANRRARQLIGRSLDEIRRMHQRELHPPENRRRCEQLFRHYTRRGRATTNAIYVVDRAGKKIPVEVSASMVDADGQRLVQGVFRDLRERRRNEQKLRRREAQLAHVARVATMGEIACALAHELNQPLGAISNYAGHASDLCGDGQLDQQQVSDVLAKIRQLALHSGEVTRRLRDIVAKSTPKRAPVDINAVVLDALRLLPLDSVLRGTRIHLELSGQLWPVNADSVQIQQVVINLVQNALQAMQGTELRKRQLFVGTYATQSEVVVHICDRGSGIAPRDFAKLFAPYFTTKPDGLGMGLPICRSLIRSHGGRIWAQPYPLGGALFAFSLPRHTTRTARDCEV